VLPGGEPAPEVVAAHRVVSTGFVRSKLTVLQGGVSNGAATAHASGGIEMSSGLAFATMSEQLHSTTALAGFDTRVERIRTARLKGYEGDSCGECGNFTLVRNGTCLKCDTCGSTSGCS